MWTPWKPIGKRFIPSTKFSGFRFDLMSPPAGGLARWFLHFVLAFLFTDFERRKQNEVQISIWANRGDAGTRARA